MLKRSGGENRMRKVLVSVPAVAAVGVFLGVVGPFGSYFAGPTWQRVIYWTSLLLLGRAVFGAGAKFVLRRGHSVRRSAAELTLLSLALAIPFSAAVSLVATFIWPHLKTISAGEWYTQVVCIALPLTLGIAFASRRADEPSEQDPATAPTKELPLGVPAQSVLCLQMEDHYVRVHTLLGSRLVLCTMQQAIAALGGLPGLQVHRSWWVANSAVDAAYTESRNVRLRLKNGIIAPVSRSSVAAVREAGWL